MSRPLAPRKVSHRQAAICLLGFGEQVGHAQGLFILWDGCIEVPAAALAIGDENAADAAAEGAGDGALEAAADTQRAPPNPTKPGGLTSHGPFADRAKSRRDHDLAGLHDGSTRDIAIDQATFACHVFDECKIT